jgi:hypothetical protein
MVAYITIHLTVHFAVFLASMKSCARIRYHTGYPEESLVMTCTWNEVNAAHARASCGSARRKSNTLVCTPVSRLADELSDVFSRFLEWTLALALPVRTNQDDLNNVYSIGAAIRKRGKFGSVQYLRKPTFLRQSARASRLSERYLPIVTLHPGIDAGRELVAPRTLIHIASTTKLPVSDELRYGEAQCNEETCDDSCGQSACIERSHSSLQRWG